VFETKKSLLFATFIALTLHGSIALCQQLTIQTEDGKQKVLSRTEIEALPHMNILTKASGTSTTFVGVSVKTLLEKAGVTFGETLRRKRLASCLLVEAADGYCAVIALPELDSAFTDRVIVLAFLRDGKSLDEK
jgi:hypothetical protein